MDEGKGVSTKSILLIMLIIVVLAVLGAVALYVRSLPGADVPYETIVIKEEQPEDFLNQIKEDSEAAEGAIDVDKIRTLALVYNDVESKVSFKYEFYKSNGSLMFSGWLSTPESDLGCAGQKIATSRLRDVAEILEKYVVGSKIEEFIQNPEMEYNAVDDIGNLEIILTDGRHASFGYPNGAGNALAKYCRTLTEWLAISTKKE